MSLNRPISIPAQRMTVIDALRGFALLGVILMHMLEHFGYSSPVNPAEARFPQLDMVIHWIAGKLISGRFINIFSFLFGLSFFIQMDRASKKGIDFRGRFLWRMVLLFVIGLMGTLFTYLDILSIYAVFGIILVFLFPFKNWVLIVFASLLLSGAPLMTIIGFDKLTLNTPTAIHSTPLPDTLDDVNAELSSQNNTTIKGAFFQSVKENITTKNLEKLNYQFRLSSRGYITLALFILGFLVGRIRFFEEVHVKRKKNLLLLFGFIFLALLIELTSRFWVPKQPINLIQHITEDLDVPIYTVVSSTLNDLGSLMQSGILVMGFIVLYQTGLKKQLNILSFYGRMGLTNYEMQGIIGAIIFSMWGFGSIFGAWGSTELFLLGLIIYFAQIIISKYWMKHYLYGPLEWLWRSGTYLKWQPFKRK